MAEKQLIVLLTIQAQDYASKVIETNEAGLAHLSQTLLSTGTAMTAGVTLPIVGAGAALFHFAADWQSNMMEIQNNTNMSAAAVKGMESTVMQLGAESGASLNNLSEGFQHAFNLTQNLTASQAELKVANEAAVATGDNAANTTNTLANAMHEYGMDVSSATTTTGQYNDILANSNHIMGVMHLATTLSNTTLDQWSQNTARATATAANLGVPIEQVSAVVATLSKHGFPDLSEAQTQAVSMMTHMIHPAKQAETELQALSKTTGVDLVSDFSAAGLSSKGFTGIMEDLKTAYTDAGLSAADQTEETMKLLNAQRGGLGMATLLGTGYSDYNSILAQLNDTQQVNTITEDQYQRSLQTAGVQLHIAEQRAKEMAITLGGDLLPAMTGIIGAIGQVAQFLSGVLGPILQALPQWVDHFAVTLLALVAIMGPLVVLAGALAAALAVISGPVVLIALGIAALIAVSVTLYQNWDAITARVPQLATALSLVKTALSDLWTVFAYTTAGIIVYWKLVNDTLINSIKALIDVFTGFGHVISDVLSGNFSKISKDATTAGDAIDAAFKQSFDNFKDAPKDVENLAQSMDGWINKTHDATTATEQSTSASLAHIAAVNMEIDAAQKMASAADAAAQSTGTWADAQNFLDQSAQAAIGNVGVWNNKIKDAQSAQDILNQELKDGSINQDDYTKKTADLTWYINRMGNGIKNDLNPSIVNSQLALADFTRTQDDLRQKLADGQITQDQYNTAMQAAGDAAKANLDDNGKLTVSMDGISDAVKNLNDTLHNLLIAMGVIPPDLDVTVKETGTAQVQQGIDHLGESLHGVPPTTTVGFATAGVPDTLSHIQQVNDAIDGVPSSFTVNANVNISGAIASIAQLDRMMPHSPAKEGPLSQLPNWDALFQGLDASADKYGKDAVVKVKDYVDAIQSAFSALKSGIDIGSLESQGGHLPSADLMTQFEAQTEQLTQALGASASLMSSDFVTAAKSYSDASKSGWEMLDGALKFATDYATAIQEGTYLTIPDDLITQMKFSSEHLVMSLGDSAALLGAEFVSSASDYANTVKTGWDALGGALKFASDYATALNGDGVVFPPDDLVSQLKFSSEHLVQSLGDSAAIMSSQFVASAQTYATAIKDGWDALGGALKFASDYATALAGDGVLFPSDDLITQIKFSSEHMMQSLGDSAALMAPDFVTKAEAYATAVKDGWDALGSAVKFAADYATALSGDGVLLPTTDFLDQIDSVSQELITRLGQSGTTLGADLSTAAKTFASSVKSGFDALGAVVSFMSSVSQAMTNGVDLSATGMDDLVNSLVTLSEKAVTALATVAADFDTKLGPQAAAAGVSMKTASQQISSDAGLMKDAFSTLTAALDFLEAATKFDAGFTRGSGKNKTTTANTQEVSDPFVDMLMGLVTQITGAFRDAALAFGTTGLTAAKNFAATVKPVIDVIKPALDAFQAIEQEGVLTQRMVDRFVKNLTLALSVINQLPDAAKLPLSQAQAFATTAKQIAAALQAGIDILKPFGIDVTINGITVGSSGGSSSGGSTSASSARASSGGGAPSGSDNGAPPPIGSFEYIEAQQHVSRGTAGTGGQPVPSSMHQPIYLTADLHIDGNTVSKVVDQRMFTAQRNRIRYRQ